MSDLQIIAQIICGFIENEQVQTCLDKPWLLLFSDFVRYTTLGDTQ